MFLEGTGEVFLSLDPQSACIQTQCSESWAFYSNGPSFSQHPNISLLIITLPILSVLDFEQTMVLLACGPYTTSDSITYDPLLDLITIINHDRPDVCILVGTPLGALCG
jgi:hypothetical protein